MTAARCEGCGKSLEAHEVYIYGARGGDPIQWTARIFDGRPRRVEVRCSEPVVLLRVAAAYWSRFADDLAAVPLLTEANRAYVTQAAKRWTGEHGAVPTEVERFARLVLAGGERVGAVNFRGYYGARSAPLVHRPHWRDEDVLTLLGDLMVLPAIEDAAEVEAAA